MNVPAHRSRNLHNFILLKDCVPSIRHLRQSGVLCGWAFHAQAGCLCSLTSNAVFQKTELHNMYVAFPRERMRVVHLSARSRGSTKRHLLRPQGWSHLKCTRKGNAMARRLCYLLFDCNSPDAVQPTLGPQVQKLMG